MNKCVDWFSGSANIPDTQDNMVFQDTKSRIPVANNNGFPSLLSLFKNGTGNGLYSPSLASTDLYMSVDDAGGSTWPSRVGSQSAVKNGSPDVSVETPLYPNGLFSGVGYRKGMRSTLGNYYVIPPNPINDLTATSQTTYDTTFITGDFSTAEIIMYNDAAAGFNFYLATIPSAGIPIIEARVSHLGGDAVVQYACSRYCLYKVKITYTGSTKTLTMTVNADTGNSSVGVGAIVSGGGTSGLGIASLLGSSPLQTGYLVEIIRHQTIVQDSPDWFNQVMAFMGMKDEKNVYPNFYVRTTKALIYVNNKMWQLGSFLPRMTQNGYCSEYQSINVLQNSTFTEAIGTGFTQAAGGVGLSYQADTDDNKTVGGTGLRIDNNIFGQEHGVYWTSAFVGAGVKCWAYAEWKGLFGSGVAYLQIFNTATGKYYNKTTQLWQASPFYIALGATSSTKVKTDFFFNNDSTGGPIFFFACNGAQADTTSCIFFHVQFMPAYDVVAQPFVYEGVSGGNSKSSESLYYPSLNNINFSSGKLTVDFRPQKSSTELSANNGLAVFGLDNNVLYTPANSGAFRLDDNTNTCSISPSYARNALLSLTATWGGSQMRISELSSGLSASAAFDGSIGANNYIGIGQSLFQSSSQPYGFIKNLKIK